jgi:hypothetical protein
MTLIISVVLIVVMVLIKQSSISLETLAITYNSFFLLYAKSSISFHIDSFLKDGPTAIPAYDANLSGIV